MRFSRRLARSADPDGACVAASGMDSSARGGVISNVRAAGLVNRFALVAVTMSVVLHLWAARPRRLLAQPGPLPRQVRLRVRRKRWRSIS